MSSELSKQDVNLANWMADCLKQDGVTAEQFAKCPREFIEAYGDVIARKIEKIQTICNTRQGAKSDFNDLVLSIA